MRLRHVEANPLVDLKLRREKPAKKPEITDKEMLEVRETVTRNDVGGSVLSQSE